LTARQLEPKIQACGSRQGGLVVSNGNDGMMGCESFWHKSKATFYQMEGAEAFSQKYHGATEVSFCELGARIFLGREGDALFC